MRIIALIEEPEPIRHILTAIGDSITLPCIHLLRTPPEWLKSCCSNTR